MSHFIQPISKTIWEMKYRYMEGEVPKELSIAETWRRVAHAMASAEKADERIHWESEFLALLEDFRFLPGGRILAGAGTQHAVTLFNCFVMNIAEDSMTGIFDALREGALTLQQGGGIGYDFSVLRPAGDLAKNTGLHASGPVSFMQIWDAMCGVLLSTGARRGAMMGVLACDHPDIEAFIEAKSDPRLLRHFNVSVFVSDAFLQAVRHDSDWSLQFHGKVYRKIKAKELWNKILRAAYDYGEPGVLFADTINRLNNLWYCESIHATNPCGEIPLPAYGACDLGAINLTQFVVSPFTKAAHLNWALLEESVCAATRFLDNVIDVSRYPLPVQQAMAEQTRRIGLGVTGLADTFVMLGLHYDSKSASKLAGEMMQRIAYVTWQTSIDLARMKGAFPLFEKRYLQGEFVQQLPPDIRHEIEKHGIRNSHHNTIAPAGTISLLANNISNGIEPIYAANYIRKVRMLNGDVQTFSVQDYAYALYQQNKEGSPEFWQDTTSLTPASHLAIQAAMQPFIDNAISKTINLPESFPFDRLGDVYMSAYQLGLKGCTIFRPNPITGSILESDKTDRPANDQCCQT